MEYVKNEQNSVPLVGHSFKVGALLSWIYSDLHVTEMNQISILTSIYKMS